MSERDDSVFLAKLAEQAERYEGKWNVFDDFIEHFVSLDSGRSRVDTVDKRSFLKTF